MTVLPSEADIIDKIEHVRSGPEPDLGVPIGQQPAQLGHRLLQFEVAQHLGRPGPPDPAARPQIAQRGAGRPAAQEHGDQCLVGLAASGRTQLQRADADERDRQLWRRNRRRA